MDVLKIVPVKKRAYSNTRCVAHYTSFYEPLKVDSPKPYIKWTDMTAEQQAEYLRKTPMQLVNLNIRDKIWTQLAFIRRARLFIRKDLGLGTGGDFAPGFIYWPNPQRRDVV
jgi:hypothetical protein